MATPKISPRGGGERGTKHDASSPSSPPSEKKGALAPSAGDVHSSSSSSQSTGDDAARSVNKATLDEKGEKEGSGIAIAHSDDKDLPPSTASLTTTNTPSTVNRTTASGVSSTAPGEARTTIDTDHTRGQTGDTQALPSSVPSPKSSSSSSSSSSRPSALTGGGLSSSSSPRISSSTSLAGNRNLSTSHAASPSPRQAVGRQTPGVSSSSSSSARGGPSLPLSRASSIMSRRSSIRSIDSSSMNQRRPMQSSAPRLVEVRGQLAVDNISSLDELLNLLQDENSPFYLQLQDVELRVGPNQVTRLGEALPALRDHLREMQRQQQQETTITKISPPSRTPGTVQTIGGGGGARARGDARSSNPRAKAPQATSTQPQGGALRTGIVFRGTIEGRRTEEGVASRGGPGRDVSRTSLMRGSSRGVTTAASLSSSRGTTGLVGRAGRGEIQAKSASGTALTRQATASSRGREGVGGVRSIADIRREREAEAAAGGGGRGGRFGLDEGGGQASQAQQANQSIMQRLAEVQQEVKSLLASEGVTSDAGAAAAGKMKKKGDGDGGGGGEKKTGADHHEGDGETKKIDALKNKLLAGSHKAGDGKDGDGSSSSSSSSSKVGGEGSKRKEEDEKEKKAKEEEAERKRKEEQEREKKEEEERKRKAEEENKAKEAEAERKRKEEEEREKKEEEERKRKAEEENKAKEVKDRGESTEDKSFARTVASFLLRAFSSKDVNATDTDEKKKIAESSSSSEKKDGEEVKKTGEGGAGGGKGAVAKKNMQPKAKPKMRPKSPPKSLAANSSSS
ncbi:hypothetical protein CSUI_003208 [Cystoisospora suis]|uniref:Uncharacterized protein n=1 Tax=Cystoisospora suis TaxID=483139 RepID=A0A2C6L3I3_9APIC|nr:hypothetical protein CSUI_003208 [Cystoisospora suis]